MPVLSRIEIKAQERGFQEGFKLGFEIGLKISEIEGIKTMLIKHFAHEFPEMSPQILQELKGLNNLQQIYAIVGQLYEIETLAALQKLLDKPFLQNDKQKS